MAQSGFMEKFDHILEFQLNELTNALYKAEANFLVAQGCMHTIEFMGGLRNGKLGEEGQVKLRFFEGVDLLGGDYRQFGKSRMYELRNSLTHEYLPKVRKIQTIFLAIYTETEGGETDNAIALRPDGHAIAIDLTKLIDDLRKASKNLRHELEQDPAKMALAEAALSRVPELA